MLSSSFQTNVSFFSESLEVPQINETSSFSTSSPTKSKIVVEQATVVVKPEQSRTPVMYVGNLLVNFLKTPIVFLGQRYYPKWQ